MMKRDVMWRDMDKRDVVRRDMMKRERLGLFPHPSALIPHP